MLCSDLNGLSQRCQKKWRNCSKIFSARNRILRSFSTYFGTHFGQSTILAFHFDTTIRLPNNIQTHIDAHLHTLCHPKRKQLTQNACKCCHFTRNTCIASIQNTLRYTQTHTRMHTYSRSRCFPTSFSHTIERQDLFG